MYFSVIEIQFKNQLQELAMYAHKFIIRSAGEQILITYIQILRKILNNNNNNNDNNDNSQPQQCEQQNGTCQMPVDGV